MKQKHIMQIIHERMEQFFSAHATLPKKIPVTTAEYHTLEESLFLTSCNCNNPHGRKKHPLLYRIPGTSLDILIELNNALAESIQRVYN